MLKKLMKYEFKATGRLMLPLYGALIGLALINKIFIGFNMEQTNMDFAGGVPSILALIAYIGTMAAVFICALFITIQRFYKNLFGDEGYLMNTLPVRPYQNIIAKLLVSMAWFILSGIVAMISIVIMAFYPEMIKDVLRCLKEVPAAFGEVGIDILGIVEFAILGLIWLAHEIMTFYASISIGQMCKSNKILGSFGAFLVINFVEQVILFIGCLVVFNVGNFENVSSNNTFLGGIIAGVGLFALLFFVTNHVLSNKLNLE